MEPSPSAKPSRRRLFAGAATVGAAAAVSSVLPRVLPASAPAQAAQLPPPPERGGGYSLSEHVQRYYRTTRV